eukprot:6936-Heterococcus_DN1.PRE.4
MTLQSLQAQLTALQQELAQHDEQSARRHAVLQQGLSRLATAVQLHQVADAGHQKQSAKRAHMSSDGTSALCEDVILDTVFSFVGIKDYIFAAGVSRQWRVRYLKLCYSETARANKAETISKLRTSFRNAAVTAARLQVAFDSGLTVADLQSKPGASASALARHSSEPIAVLTLARVYGLQWTADYTRAAASRNDTLLVQWMLQCGCPYDAAVALAKGRDWIGWNCQKANPAQFYCAKTGFTAAEHNDAECTVAGCRKRNPAAVFAWAHDTGCPCICDVASSSHSNSGDSDNDDHDG